MVKKYRVGWAGAKRGWVVSFGVLGKGWVVQLSASHGGGPSFFFKRNRHTFICQPIGEISLEKESNIQNFSEKYAVDQDLVVRNIHHLAYLNMMKQKGEGSKVE